MKARGFNHVGITVKDFNKAVRWYRDVFGFSLISKGGLDAERMSRMKKLYNLPDGMSVRFGFLLGPRGGLIEIFEFSETAPFEHCWNRPGTHHFTLDVKNIGKWYKKLSERSDVEILNEPQRDDGADWFFFRDPDGNLIELMDLHANYFPIKYMSRLIGFFMRKGNFKDYYK